MNRRRGRAGSVAIEQFWRRMVEGFEPEQTTIRQWCVDHGVSEQSFYAWRRELARRDRSVPRQASRAEPRPVSLLPVRIVSSGNELASKVTVRLARGLHLRVSVAQLAQVLDVLERRSC